MDDADALVWLERAAREATPRDTGRLREANNVERLPMNDRSNRKPMSPWNGLAVIAVLMVMVLAFGFGIAAIVKWVM